MLRRATPLYRGGFPRTYLILFAGCVGCLMVLIFMCCVSLDKYSRNLENPASLAKHTLEVCGRPTSNIYFLKIHKTASSSFANILKRYALKHDLKYPMFYPWDSYPSKDMNAWLFPVKKYIKTCETSTFSCGSNFTFMREEAVEDNAADIIDTHTVFNATAVHEILGSNPAMVVAIRHPFSQMQSLMYQFNLWPYLVPDVAAEHTLETFLANPAKFDVKLPTYNRKYSYNISHTQNHMAFMFGYKTLNGDGWESTSQFLERINKSFDVVLLAEHFTESLVLTKRKFCWSLEDVMSVHLNYVESKEYKNYLKAVSPRNEKLIEQHRQWSSVDYALYDMFVARFKHEVDSQTNDFWEEVAVLKSLNAKITTFCSKFYELVETWHEAYQQILDRSLYIDGTKFNRPFTVSMSDCVYLAFNTHRFHFFLACRQYPDLCKNPAFTVHKDHPQIIKNITDYCPHGSGTSTSHTSGHVFKHNFPLEYVLKPGSIMVKNPWRFARGWIWKLTRS